MRVRQRKAGETKHEDYFAHLVEEKTPLPTNLMLGITRAQVSAALTTVDRGSDLLIEVVCALLDDQFPNLFNPSLPLSLGASTSHIACYVGIYIRNGKKLDREGRDYWIKPLREIGLIEAVTYNKSSKSFSPGHLVAKSPNSAYRLDSNFISLLASQNTPKLTDYFKQSNVGKRLVVQSQAAEYIAKQSGRGNHHRLIQLAAELYASTFLPSFKVLYTDDSDGDRVSLEEQKRLKDFGISISLEDSFPDIILGNEKGELWFIEAVTSDGEVDESKLRNLELFCEKYKKKLAGATTCYLTWKSLASRQGPNKNIAINSHIWIAEDPSKHFKASDD